MARNIKSNQAAADDDEAQDSAPMPGGASGAPDDPNPVATAIGGPQVTAGLDHDSSPAAPARRFKVVGGGRKDENGRFRVMYDGSSTHVALGKVYEEHHADLDLLRRQGILLEEILPG